MTSNDSHSLIFNSDIKDLSAAAINEDTFVRLTSIQEAPVPPHGSASVERASAARGNSS